MDVVAGPAPDAMDIPVASAILVESSVQPVDGAPADTPAVEDDPENMTREM